MAMTKADYEATLGRKLSDAEYGKLANGAVSAPVAIPNALDFASSLGSGPGLAPDAPPDPIKFKGDWSGKPVNSAGKLVIPGKQSKGVFAAPLGDNVMVVDPPPGFTGDSYTVDPQTGDMVTPGGQFVFVPAPGGGSWQEKMAPGQFGPPSPPPGVIKDEQTAPVPIGPPGPPPMLAKPPPSPAPMPQPGAAYKGGSGALGGGPPPAPPQPLDVGNFGKTPHEIEAEKQGQKHAINQLNYQNQASDVEIAQAAEFDAIAQKAAAEADAKARAAEASIAKRKAFLETYNADTMRAIEEYSKAEIDPNKYWADRGTGGAVLAAVGVLLGGLGAAFAARAGKDQSNVGLDMIEKGIQRDIELQKANIAKKGAGIEARKGLYGMYLQQFGSEDAAEAMAYETYLRKTKAQIDATAAKTTNEQVKIRAAALSESLEDRIKQMGNRNMIAGEKMYDQYLAKKEAMAAAGAQAQASEMKRRNEAIFKAQLDIGTERAKKIGGTVLPLSSPAQLPNGAVIPAGSVVVLDKNGQIDMEGTEATQKVTTVNMPVLQPGGGVAYAPTQVQKDGYGKAAEQIIGATNAIKAIEQMEAADKMPGPWVGEKKKLFNQAQKNYATAYGVASGMGALSEADLEIVYSTIPGVPTWGVGYMSDAERATLANQKKTLAEKAKTAGQVYGTPGTAGPAPLTSVGAAK